MNCPSCSNPLEPSARFCPLCGTARPNPAIAEPFSAAPFAPSTRLFRPRSPRVIAGVCSGFALHYGWDLTLVRMTTVVVTLVTGVGLFVYLAAWIIVPEAQYALPAPTVPVGSIQH